MDTVPKTVTTELLAFCRTLSDALPAYIRSMPSQSAKQSFCFDNVAEKIAANGGSLVTGWAIWHVPGIYFEAEHHGVWGNGTGGLIDVSPQLGGAKRILFLSDVLATYDPQLPRPNVMQAASSDPRAVEFAQLANERVMILNRYHAGGPKVAILKPHDHFRLGQIMPRLQLLMNELRR